MHYRNRSRCLCYIFLIGIILFWLYIYFFLWRDIFFERPWGLETNNRANRVILSHFFFNICFTLYCLDMFQYSSRKGVLNFFSLHVLNVYIFFIIGYSMIIWFDYICKYELYVFILSVWSWLIPALITTKLG